MVDSTLGEGGHSEAFLARFPRLSVLGLDADPRIQARARERLSAFAEAGRMRFWNGWFNDFYADFGSRSDVTGGRRPDVVLFDLGISVFHYERSGRGFSLRRDEPLDMRLDESAGESAADIVNGAGEEELADMIYRYSDERHSRRIAREIVRARSLSRIESSLALAEIVRSAVPERERHGRIHPATRTFQALRIAVNGELRRLPEALHAAFNALAEGGKMGVITFHSLEDRIVKGYFRSLSRSCVCPPERPSCTCGGSPCAELLTRRPVEPTEAEVGANSPSRSARLRVVRKVRDADGERLAAAMR